MIINLTNTNTYIIIISRKIKMQEYLFNQTDSNYQDQNDFDKENIQNPIKPIYTPGKKSPLKQKEKSLHCQAFCATILLITGIITGITLANSGYESNLCAGIFILSYIAYICIGCINNKLLIYIQSIDSRVDFNTVYKKMRYLPGIFIFTARCYHTQTVQRSRTVTDSDGNQKTEYYTQTYDVETHRAKEMVVPCQTIDQSEEIDSIRSEHSIIFVHFYANKRFFDDQSRINFAKIYDNFKRANTRDEKQEFDVKYQVADFIKRKSFKLQYVDCDFNCFFVFFTMIGLIWPYSLWIQTKISRFDVQIKRSVKF